MNLRFLLSSVLVGALFFFWGIATVGFRVFPWSIVLPIDQEIQAFVKGDASEKTDIVEKLANDLSIRPSRQLYDYTASQTRVYSDVQIPGLRNRRARPKLYLPEVIRHYSGYRFIFGTFDFQSHLHGGVLLDNHNRVVQTWEVDEQAIIDAIKSENEKGNRNIAHKPAARRLPQGVEIFPDGSIIFNDGDRGNGMHRIDLCGNYTWTTLGNFHHAITYDEDDGTIWSFGPGDMMQLDPETGSILKIISLEQLQRANPSLNLFSARRDIANGKWHYDPIHKNDIEPLTNKHLTENSEFERGDLLVSHRATNLIFVFSPATLAIKWWRAGQTRRQHDPDWGADGNITVFDNNFRENYSEEWDGYLPDGDSSRYSRIWKINTTNHESQIIYDGKKDDMYSGERSKHQVLPNGNILITSAHQGRIIEVTATGDTVFEFLNSYDNKQNLILSEAIWLPNNFFTINLSDRSKCSN